MVNGVNPGDFSSFEGFQLTYYIKGVKNLLIRCEIGCYINKIIEFLNIISKRCVARFIHFDYLKVLAFF